MATLLLVDLQNDFCPDGALAIVDGDQAVFFANRLIPQFEKIIATQDWHPKNHGSFFTQHPQKKPGDQIQLGGKPQILWVEHCVQNTFGAAFHPHLHLPKRAFLQKKGQNPNLDSYSAFFENDQKTETGLHAWLQKEKENKLFVLGLATDYCVKYTVLDALHLGYQVSVYQQGCFGVNLHPEDSKKALQEMQKAGAVLL